MIKNISYICPHFSEDMRLLDKKILHLISQNLILVIQKSCQS